jgi:hypothetical protein
VNSADLPKSHPPTRAYRGTHMLRYSKGQRHLLKIGILRGRMNSLTVIERPAIPVCESL